MLLHGNTSEKQNCNDSLKCLSKLDDNQKSYDFLKKTLTSYEGDTKILVSKTSTMIQRKLIFLAFIIKNFVIFNPSVKFDQRYQKITGVLNITINTHKTFPLTSENFDFDYLQF